MRHIAILATFLVACSNGQFDEAAFKQAQNEPAIDSASSRKEDAIRVDEPSYFTSNTGATALSAWNSSTTSNGAALQGISAGTQALGTAVGVHGESSATNAGANGFGVYAVARSTTSRAVFAVNYSSGGTAIEASGGLKVYGSQPAAFTVRCAGAPCVGNTLIIDSPHANGRPNAMVFVTHNWNPPGMGGVYVQSPVGAFYNTGSNKWAVYTENGSTIPANAAFNVLIINQ